MKELAGIVALIAFALIPVAAWITHCVWWVKLLMNDQMDTMGEAVLTVLGTIVLPIGTIHGFVLWF